jgi:hypothetical protein
MARAERTAHANVSLRKLQISPLPGRMSMHVDDQQFLKDGYIIFSGT